MPEFVADDEAHLVVRHQLVHARVTTMNGVSIPMVQALTCGDWLTNSSGFTGASSDQHAIVEQRIEIGEPAVTPLARRWPGTAAGVAAHAAWPRTP